MQISTNDNSHSFTCEFHTFCYTDGLFEKKACLSICFPRKKNFFRDFRFSFPRESSFPRRIPGSELFVSCVCKRRWRLGRRKCRKMPESDISVCRKAKVVESHIVYMLKWSKKNKNKKKEILISKVWFYGNSVKLRQSPTHAYAKISPKMVNPRDIAGEREEFPLTCAWAVQETYSNLSYS